MKIAIVFSLLVGFSLGLWAIFLSRNEEFLRLFVQNYVTPLQQQLDGSQPLEVKDGITGNVYLDLLIQLFNSIDLKLLENPIIKFAGTQTFIQTGVVVFFILIEAQRENRSMRFSALQIALSLASSISFIFPALTVPLFQHSIDQRHKSRVPSSSSFRALVFSLACVVAVAAYALRTFLPHSDTWGVKVLLAIYLGLILGCLALLAYFSFFSLFMHFRSFSPVFSSRVIVAAYFILIPICIATWVRSLLELFPQYEWSIAGISDPQSPLSLHLLRDLRQPGSSSVYVLDLIGLTLGFMLFILSQNASLFPLTIVSLLFSPAALFCFQRIQAENKNIEEIQTDIDSSKQRKTK